jgi:two-component system, OmpR family, response regulator
MIRSCFCGRRNQILAIKTYLIEDNALIRENLTGTLHELTEVKVIGCVDTEAAGLALLHKTESWQLLIVDLFLRQGSGLKVIAACRDRDSVRKVVVLTNYATPDVRKQCLKLGADAVFDKSTELDDLIEYCRGLSAAKVSA